MNILCIGLEFSTWKQARSWSYNGLYSFMDGFKALGHRVVFVPAIAGTVPGDPQSWLTHAPSLLDGEVFDQAWIWITHNAYTPEFWEWFDSIAPIRVAMVMESMTAEEEDIAQLPHLAHRQAAVLNDLRHCTHALVCDEIDAPVVSEKLGIPAIWHVTAVASEFVRIERPPVAEKGIFVGAANNARRQAILSDPKMLQVLERAHLPENDTSLPATFDRVHAEAATLLASAPPTRADLDTFAGTLQELRRSLFELLIAGFREGIASVNLPSYFKSYPSRVVEAMAASVPVITWRVPNRPGCAQLFEEGRDILFFDGEKPETLNAEIRRLQADADLCSRLVTNARVKLLALHTAELRAAQQLDWIRTGVHPDYFNPPGPTASEEECCYYSKLFVETPEWSQRTPNGDEQSRWEKIKVFLASVAAEAEGRNLRIMDVGCGRGWLAGLAAEFGAVEAADLVPEVIDAARANFPNVVFHVASIQHLLKTGHSERYDVVLSSEVIEHVPLPFKREFVEGVAKLLRPGGHVIITTPRADIRDEWEARYGKPPQPVEDWLTEDQLAQLFESAGFLAKEMARAFLMDIYQIWLFQKK
ncbi:MAG: methyltransferase domain-containing protein [Bacteroidales bacterium]